MTPLFIAFSLAVDGQERQKDFVYQEAETCQVIPYRNGVLVESGEGNADKIMYAAAGAQETLRVEVEDMQFVFDAERNGKDVLFLGLKDKKIAIYRELPDGGRASVVVPDAFHPRYYEDLLSDSRPFLIETRHQAAVMAGNVVWWLDGGWKSRKIPQVPAFHREFKRGNAADHYYLDGSTLYVGWDQGEWGGMLASIDLGTERAKWKHLGGKKDGDVSGLPGNEPVVSIISPEAGHFWVSTGLLHGATAKGALYHRTPDGKWCVIAGWGEGGREGGLPPESSIEGMAADNEGRVHVIGSFAGILRLENGKLKQLGDRNMLRHELSRTEGSNTFSVPLYANDVGISSDGGIFVSTNNFGVVEVREKDGVWTPRQIKVHASDVSKLDGNALPPSREDGIKQLPDDIEGD